MAGVLSDYGIEQLNAFITAGMVGNVYKVKLFTNNHTPDVSDVIGDYTEATFGGYAPQNMPTVSSAPTSGNINVATFNGVTFTATGAGLPETCYGYFITDTAGTGLIGAELFPVPLTLSVAGQGINVVPGLTYQDRSIP